MGFLFFTIQWLFFAKPNTDRVLLVFELIEKVGRSVEMELESVVTTIFTLSATKFSLKVFIVIVKELRLIGASLGSMGSASSFRISASIASTPFSISIETDVVCLLTTATELTSG